ncbi:MAG TPA: isoprenylcysteine carboxylmethyltransferase family protein, partial [Candidatus Kryptobacter bacterium]|nr:isoprenylcysteine carboxylmethyltransferase family protein [Candidatus Kryptobacter bacterium]
MGALFIPMLFVLVYLLLREPDLLGKRMKTPEKEKPQKAYVVLSVAAFVGVFAVPGFDYRHSWSDVPDWLVVISTVMMEVGYATFFVVMRQNRYASRLVEIQEGQKLIDTGLYSIVRHPMYTSASVLYIFSALVLGSYYALIPTILIPFL